MRSRCWLIGLAVGLFLVQATPSGAEDQPKRDRSTDPAVHEVFRPPVADPVARQAPRMPPKPRVEYATSRPSAKAEWIPGYWDYVEPRKEFAWVPGVWMVPPPDLG